MNTVFTALLRLRTSLLAALLLAASVLLAQTLSAQENVCAFVKAPDVAALLGGTIIAPPPAGPCVWKVADSKRKLLVLTYTKLPVPVATAYTGFHDKSTREADEKIIDESGIADKAFSITPSFGVAFVMLKGERLLQLQYWTGARGTEKDRDALRVVARKATTAF